MRINVYSQELTEDTQIITKEGTDENGSPATFWGVRLYLHSPELLHHTPEDDDRSGITFWLPTSEHRRRELAATFRALADLTEIITDDWVSSAKGKEIKG